MNIRHTFKRSAQATAALLLMGAAIGSAQAASVVTNGSFETAGATVDDAAGWSVDAGVAQRRADRGASDGDWAMLFNTGGGANGTISQVLTVDTRLVYNLTFDLGMFWGAGEGPQTMRYKVTEVGGAGLRNEVVTTENLTNTPLINNWEGQFDQFISFASGRTVDVLLEFIDESTNNGGFDLALDNVAVNPVPLPPAAWLLGSALFGLLSIGKRKRQS